MSLNQTPNSPQNVTYELTPNPMTMKFLLHTKVSDEGFDCPDVQSSERSPLANKIFGFPWASSVYVGTDFITITKQDWVDWELIANPLTAIIQEHLDRNEPVVVQLVTSPEDDPNDSPMVRDIKSLLNREIRPVVALDGGDIVFSKYEDNILYIHMKGACSGCPSSTITLKEGVEVRMKEVFPEIKEVVSI